MKSKTAYIWPMVALVATAGFGALPEHPESAAFPTRTSVTASGTYVVSGEGNEVVLAGAITGNVTITADATCRVTLDNVTLSGQLAINGEAVLWATGTSTLDNGGKAVVTSTGALMLAGDGTATLTGGGAKKAKAVVYSGDAITVAGGTWNVNMSLVKEAKGFGIAATKKLKMVAGSVTVVSACTDYKDTGVYSDKKDIEISGGILRVTQYGPKSVAINTDATDASIKLTGGAVILNVGGEGAKGVKCDGTFEMSGGILNATVSGGTVRIVAGGTCSRGLVADTTLDITGGVFDIQANGATSLPVIDLVTDDVLTQVELDRKTAACIKQGDASGAVTISGGTFYLVATNYGGKCFSIDGTLTVGTKGTATLPTDVAFSPDIQCSTYGQKLYALRRRIWQRCPSRMPPCRSRPISIPGRRYPRAMSRTARTRCRPRQTDLPVLSTHCSGKGAVVNLRHPRPCRAGGESGLASLRLTPPSSSGASSGCYRHSHGAGAGSLCSADFSALRLPTSSSPMVRCVADWFQHTATLLYVAEN